MDYISVKEFALKWGVSERTARNYCSGKRIDGAILVGKTWLIPLSANPPKKKKKSILNNPLLNTLREQKSMRLKGGIYHKTQIELSYNSNRIEGSRLTKEQTRYIFETNTIGITDNAVNIDDIIETTNHFRAIDFCIDNAEALLSEQNIKEIHKIIKSGTSDSSKDWFRVGDYKLLPNEVGGCETTPPDRVTTDMREIIDNYNAIKSKRVEDIIDFHHKFESIHPFQDGNGRVGRLIMFKECLANNIVPIIIEDDLKMFYYRGLQNWPTIKGYLMDTCLTAQDRYKDILSYFKIDASN